MHVGHEKVLILTINECSKLSNDCVNASNLNMSKNKIDISDKGGELFLLLILSTHNLEHVALGGSLVKSLVKCVF